MILHSRSTNNQKLNQTCTANLKLELDSLECRSTPKDALENSQTIPSMISAHQSGSITERIQIKKQKKLNSSIKTKRSCLNVDFEKSIRIKQAKPNKFSIFRTVSVAYVNLESKPPSKLIHFIRKDQNSLQNIEPIQYPNLDQFRQNEINNFITIRRAVKRYKDIHQEKRCKASLININEILLKEIKSMQNTILLHQRHVMELSKQIQECNNKNLQMKKHAQILETEKHQKQQKVRAQLRRNEILLRQNNALKEKIRENLKDLQSLRIEQHDHSFTTRRCSSVRQAL